MATILENEAAWSTTAATNANVDTGINWSEGQDAASVNNSARGMMAARAKARLDLGGGLAAGGTANALTVTTNQVLSTAHLAAGTRLLIRATAANTSTTVTFAPDGLTAAPIKRADGSALAIGDIRSGMSLDLVYNAGSSEWRCATITPTGSGKTSFLAYSAGQVIASTAITQVTLGSEVFDVGSNFAASQWTPPAGTVFMSVNTQIQNNTGGVTQFIVSIVRSGTVLQSMITAPFANGQTVSAFLSLIDQTAGAYTYYVACQCGSQPYNVSAPFFSGYMI